MVHPLIEESNKLQQAGSQAVSQSSYGPEESPEDVVISGMAIRCSQSENMDEFADNLFNGINMVHVNLERCDEDFFGVPKQHGFIKDIRKFDATFFGVHPKQAEGMDPQLRILHEVAYETIVDAGIDPASLKNSNTGVFIGMSNSDAREAWTAGDVSEIDGYSLIGTHRAFLANRLSFTFDLRGPSFGIDAACCTSGVSINQGYLHIKNGQCDAAIVGGVSLVYNPKVSYQILKLGLLCKDGKCKVFDEAADGYVRSEAIVTLMLQRRKFAKRVYATILHSKINNDGFKEQGITFPCAESQGQLITETYAEAGIDPEDVEYVETHGSGTKIGDPQEANGVAMGFANARTKPLLIGCVKTNAGHSEHASGAVSVCKVLISMKTGYIPANLHYKNPNPLIPALVDGRMRVVTEHKKWGCSLVGVNCFGFGGQNSHIVLRGNPNTRQISVTDMRLVVYMGRTEEAARHAMDYVNQYPDNPYVPYLLMQGAFAKPASMPFRGYTILNSGLEETPMQVERVSVEARPVWWIFSGQGTQWAAMGRDMLKLDIFRQSIERYANVLQPFGLDLVHILSSSTEADFDDPTISFVGTAAIQVALVDLLQVLKLNAEGFIGHSAGEIGCAYADGCLTAEEALLTAYYRGRAVKEVKLEAGAMAAVGMNWDEAQAMCQHHPGVSAACNNAADNVTVSGTAQAVTKFVDELKTKNVFAKEVKSYGIAFHSPAMQKAAPIYLQELKKVLVSPKSRTSRWLSTALNEEEWSSEVARTASAEYFAANLQSTVKFHQAMEKVPKKAIVVEIAPHGLLQVLIKKTVGGQCTAVALMKKGVDNNAQYLLQSIGTLYLNGLNPDVKEMFPKPPMPAPRDTPFIGSIVQWDHSSSWRIPHFTDFIHKAGSSQRVTKIDLQEPLNHRFMEHKIGKRTVFPVAAMFDVVAKAYAVETSSPIEKCPELRFSSIEFHGDSIKMEGKASLEFSVKFAQSINYFEVMQDQTLVMTGYIKPGSPNIPYHTKDDQQDAPSLPLTKDEVYDELRYRGYDFGPNYQVLQQAKLTLGRATATMQAAHHESAIVGLLQLATVQKPERALQRVSKIQSLVMNVPVLSSSMLAGAQAVIIPHLDFASTTGLTIEGVTWIAIEAEQSAHALPAYSLRQVDFVPFDDVKSAKNDKKVAYAKLCSDLILSEASKLVEEKRSPKYISQLLQEHRALLNGGYAKQEVQKHLDNGQSGFLQLVTSLFSGINGHQYNNMEELVKRTVPDYKTMLQNDSYLSDTSIAVHIEQLLELALENLASSEAKVMELVQMDQEAFTGLSTMTSNHSVDFKSLAIRPNQPLEVEPASVSVLVVKNYFTQGLEAITNQVRGLAALMAQDGYLLVVQPLGQYANVWNYFGAFGSDSQKQALPVLSAFVEALKKEGMQTVAVQGDNVVNNVLLCRKGTPNVNTTTVVYPAPSSFKSEDDIVRFLDDATVNSQKGDTNSLDDNSTRVWLTTATFNQSLHDYVVSKNKELNGLPFRLAVGLAEGSSQIPSEVISKDLLVNVVQGEKWGSYRSTPLQLTTPSSTAQTAKTVESLSTTQEDSAYAVAAYGLVQLARATPGQTVLIHADVNTSNLEAVVRVAVLACGLRTIVVNLTPQQSAMAQQRFSTIAKDIALIDSPLDTGVAHKIMQMTNGQGVDIVYNLTSSSQLQASSRLLKPHGTYLEPNALSQPMAFEEMHYAMNVAPFMRFGQFSQSYKAYPAVQQVLTTGATNGHFPALPTSTAATTTPNKPATKTTGRQQGSHVIFAQTAVDVAVKMAYWLATNGAQSIHIVTSEPNMAAAQQVQLQYIEDWLKVHVTQHVENKSSPQSVVAAAAKDYPLAGLYIINVHKGQRDTSALLKDVERVLDSVDSSKLQSFVIVNLRSEAVQGSAAMSQPEMKTWNQRRRPTIVIESPFLKHSQEQVEQTPGAPRQKLYMGDFFQALPHIVQQQDGVFLLNAVKEVRRSAFSSGEEGEGPQDKSRLPLTVAKIMGIKDFATLDMFLTLGDYGIDSLMALEFGQVLERDFDLSLTLQEIRALCIRDICLMAGATNAVEAAKMSGGKAPANDVDSTPTLLDNVSKHYNLQEIVPKKTLVPLVQVKDSTDVLFVVHPMEGSVLPVLATLANQLRVTTYGLNCTEQVDLTTIESLAKSYLAEVKKVQPQGPYNIAGYSFGAGVAFEMALQLQKEEGPQAVKHLIMLDGSHSFVAAFTKTMKAGYTVDPTAAVEEMYKRRQNAFETAILTLFVTQFVKTQRKQLQEKLANAVSLQARVKVAVEELHRCPQLRHIGQAELTSAASLFAERLIATDQYKPARKYTGPVSLIRASEKMVRSLGEYYELEKVCTSKLNVQTVNGNHEGFVLGDATRMTASYINDALHQ